MWGSAAPSLTPETAEEALLSSAPAAAQSTWDVPSLPSNQAVKVLLVCIHLSLDLESHAGHLPESLRGCRQWPDTRIHAE